MKDKVLSQEIKLLLLEIEKSMALTKQLLKRYGGISEKRK